MPKDYETLFIAKPDLADEEIDKEIETVTRLVESEGGSILELDRWEKKRLAYPIKKSRYGYYVLLRFTAEPSVPEKISRHFRFNENILKGMVVFFDGAAGRYQAEPRKDRPARKTEPVKETESKPDAAVETESKPAAAVETESKPAAAVETESKPAAAVETESKPDAAVETESKPDAAVETENGPGKEEGGANGQPE